MIEQLLAPFRQRRLLFELARNDFRARYTGSLLGATWAFVQPLLTILLYLFIFQIGFRTAPPSDVPFVLWLIVGIAPWFFFTDGMVQTTSALLDYSYLVKKVRFEIAIVPTIKLVASSFTHVVVWTIVVAIVAASGYPPRVSWLQVPYYFLALFTLTSGLGRLAAAITPFVRDMTQVVGVSLQFAFWLTPVMWTIGMAPPALRTLLSLNPLFYVVDGLREALFFGAPCWAHPLRMAYFWGVVVAVNLVSHLTFHRLRPHMPDVL